MNLWTKIFFATFISYLFFQIFKAQFHDNLMSIILYSFRSNWVENDSIGLTLLMRVVSEISQGRLVIPPCSRRWISWWFNDSLSQTSCRRSSLKVLAFNPVSARVCYSFIFKILRLNWALVPPKVASDLTL